MPEFHIHIDAKKVSPDLLSFALNQLNFYEANFAGVPVGSERHAPEKHLSIKLFDADSFKVCYNRLIEFIEQRDNQLEGYIEGEYIPLDEDINEKKFDPTVPVPFTFELGRLPDGKFREDEIHITLNSNESDPELIKNLRKMGFFSVYMNKPYGVAEIFTVQGSKKDIQSITPGIIDYLNRAGGSVKCSVKEERVIRWWSSSKTMQYPPVIKNITLQN